MSDQDKPENETPNQKTPSAADLEAQADEFLAKAGAESASGGNDNDADDARSDEDKIADAMEALVAENAELKDKVLRAAAEIENIRRRSEREKADASKYGAANFARAVLTVADNLGRAIDAVPEDRKDGSDAVVQSIIEGIEMTQRSLLAAFEQNGIAPIDPPLGEKLDPNYHEALFEVPGTGQPAGTIVQVVDTGYMIGERLLRPARVGVAKADDGPPPGGTVDTTA